MNNFKKILLTSCCLGFSFFDSQSNPRWKKFCLDSKNISLNSFQDFQIPLPDLSEKKEWIDLLEEAIDFQEIHLDSKGEIIDEETSALFLQKKLHQHSCIFHEIPPSILNTPEKKKDFLQKAQEYVFLKLLGVLWSDDTIRKNFSFLCTTFQKEKLPKNTDIFFSYESSIQQEELTYDKALLCVHDAFKNSLSDKEYDFLLNILFFPEGIPKNGFIPLLNTDIGNFLNHDNRYTSFFDKNLEKINYENEEEFNNFIKRLKVRSLLEDFFYEEFFSYNENFISFSKNFVERKRYEFIENKLQNFFMDFQEGNTFLSTESLEAEIRKITLNSFLDTRDKNIKYFYFFTTLVAVVNHLSEREFFDFKDFFLKNTEKEDYLYSRIIQQQAFKRIEKFTNTPIKTYPRKLIDNMKEIIFAQKEHRNKKLKLLLKKDPDFAIEAEKLNQKRKKYYQNFVVLFEEDFPKEDIFTHLYDPSNTYVSLGNIIMLLKEDVARLDNEILFLKNHSQSIKYEYSEEEKQQYLTRIQVENFLQDSIIFHYKNYENCNSKDFKKNVFLYKDDRKGFMLSHEDSPLQEPITRYYDLDQLSFGLCFYICHHSYGKKTFFKKIINRMFDDIKCLRIYSDFMHNQYIQYIDALTRHLAGQKKVNLSRKNKSNSTKASILDVKHLEPIALALFPFLSNFGYLHEMMVHHISYFSLTDEVQKEAKINTMKRDILNIYIPLETCQEEKIIIYFSNYLFPRFFETFQKRSFIYINRYEENINNDNKLTRPIA